MEVPYDVVREILARVKDVTTLFRCATTCKGWCSLLVADTSFLCRCLPQDTPSPFSGFIAQRHWHAPCFVPVPHPVLAPRPCPVLYNGRRFLDSFFPDIPTGYFNNAVPLTSRHGVLLVRLEPHHAARDPDPSGVLLAMCNPLAGTVHELPRLEHYWDFQEGNEVTGYALLTDADCSSRSHENGAQRPPGFFKVLIITVDHRQMHYNLHTFSSAGESGWTTCFGAHRISAKLMQQDAVVLHGTAHWLLSGTTGTYTLDVSAETGHVSSTEMMGVTVYSFCRKYCGKPYLTVNGLGNLTVLHLRKDGLHLEIWTSHDNGRSFQDSTLMLQQPDQLANRYTHVYTCLGEKCGMMLVKVNNRDVYIVDIKTGVMRKVPDWPSSNALNRMKIVPIEIDWMAFFASRLAYVVR